jgi:hypothetical protein
MPHLDFSRMTLAEAVRLRSAPSSLAHESGCVLVYSGRTREVLWGLWCRPGTMDGVGFHVAAVRDVSGDGYADLVVTDSDGASVFAGPGRAR